MIDGAHEGLTANQGLSTVLGGEVEEDRPMSPEEMKAWLLAAPDSFENSGDPDAYDYDDASRIIAKRVLVYLEAYPEDRHLGEGKYELDPPGDSVECLREIEPSLYDTIKQKDAECAALFSSSGMTGFMWGWALNAARRCLGDTPVPNPAIIEVE